MKRTLLSALTMGAWPALFGGLVSAHHSFSAQFDPDSPVSVTGTVTEIQWMNPHVYFHVDVDEHGEIVNYAVEGGTPNMLYRRGWRKDDLKIGDVVIVEGFRARDGTHNLINGRRVTFPDGRQVLTGSIDGGPQGPR